MLVVGLMDHFSDCGVTPFRREELILSDPKGWVAGVQHRTPRRGQESTILGGGAQGFSDGLRLSVANQTKRGVGV